MSVGTAVLSFLPCVKRKLQAPAIICARSSHHPIQLLSKWLLQVLADAFTHNVVKGQRDTWTTLASPAE